MKRKIRYLIHKPGRAGGWRWIWQPSTALRAAGWRPVQLGADFAAAVDEAERLNAQVDAWRAGGAGPAHVKPAKRGTKAPTPGSIAALIRDYRASRWYGDLAPATRKSYDRVLDAVEAWAGDAPARAITPPLVEKFYQRQALDKASGKATPAKGALAVRVLRVLFGAGRRLGYVDANPAEDPGITLEKQREPRLWEPADEAAMVEAADRLGWHSIGTAITVNGWLGQRLRDVVALPRFEAADGWLTFRQSKRKRVVSLPLHLVPQLVARLEAEAARPGAVQSATHLLVHDRTGKPWREDTFKHRFAEVRAAAAEARPRCAELWFMELRHTAITRMHEAGLEPLAIAGVSGHTVGGVQQILDRHYLVRTKKGAERAFKARLAAEAEGKV